MISDYFIVMIYDFYLIRNYDLMISDDLNIMFYDYSFFFFNYTNTYAPCMVYLPTFGWFLG